MEMNNVLVSVVMPVYNTQEMLLRAAVESVYSQNYEDYELIIVDDGSMPEIAALCDELASGKENVRVFHQSNQGVSAARNFGTAKSNGLYVMYVDSDDVLGESALSECAEVISATGADYIFGGIKKIHSVADFVAKNNDTLQYKMYHNEEIDFVKASLLGQNNEDFQNVSGGGVVNRGPYARVVKSSIAKKVFFNTSLKIGEDVVWNMQVLNCVDSACFVNRTWYGYVSNDGSAIRKYYGNRHEILGRYIDILYDNDPQFCERHIREFMSNMVAAFHTVLNTDLMSEQCPLTEKQKVRKVKEIMQSKPWNRMLMEKKVLSFKHRVIVECSRYGCIFIVLKILGEQSDGKG